MDATTQTFQYPIDVFGDTSGKWTLPKKGAPEVKLPALKTYSDEFFYLSTDKTGACCKALPLPNLSTSGSKYSRSEWRQMAPDGKTNSAWSSSDGIHAMTVWLSIEAVAKSRPHVVIAQIHGASDDLTVFRYEGSVSDPNVGTLWITNADSPHGYKLTDSYHLGTRISVGFLVEKDVTRYTFNGKPVEYTLSKAFKGAYFKTGCYIQSNLGGDDFALVIIYGVYLQENGKSYGRNLDATTPTTPPVEPPPVDPPLPPVKPSVDVQPFVDALNMVVVSIQDVVVKMLALKNQ